MSPVIAAPGTARIVFAGTPDFALPSLEALAQDNSPAREIVAVLTQPDRPAGRGRRIREGAIKTRARQLGLRIEQPATLRDPETLSMLRKLRPDLMVVAAYGLILPPAALALPRLGCINVHASVLPRWRGAAPVQRAILAGDKKTGVTLMQMDAGLDTGDILAIREVTVGADETGGELTDRLAVLGGELLLDKLEAILNGELAPRAQNDAQATAAPKIAKREAGIDWASSAAQIARQVRAFDPWPVADTTWRGQQLRVRKAYSVDTAATAAAGTVVNVAGGEIAVATGKGILVVTALQPAGKRVMSARDFLNAHRIQGDVLGH